MPFRNRDIKSQADLNAASCKWAAADYENEQFDPKLFAAFKTMQPEAASTIYVTREDGSKTDVCKAALSEQAYPRMYELNMTPKSGDRYITTPGADDWLKEVPEITVQPDIYEKHKIKSGKMLQEIADDFKTTIGFNLFGINLTTQIPAGKMIRWLGQAKPKIDKYGAAWMNTPISSSINAWLAVQQCADGIAPKYQTQAEVPSDQALQRSGTDVLQMIINGGWKNNQKLRNCTISFQVHEKSGSTSIPHNMSRLFGTLTMYMWVDSAKRLEEGLNTGSNTTFVQDSKVLDSGHLTLVPFYEVFNFPYVLLLQHMFESQDNYPGYTFTITAASLNKLAHGRSPAEWMIATTTSDQSWQRVGQWRYADWDPSTVCNIDTPRCWTRALYVGNTDVLQQSNTGQQLRYHQNSSSCSGATASHPQMLHMIAIMRQKTRGSKIQHLSNNFGENAHAIAHPNDTGHTFAVHGTAHVRPPEDTNPTCRTSLTVGIWNTYATIPYKVGNEIKKRCMNGEQYLWLATT